MESSTGRWSWQIVGTDTILTESLNLLNGTIETENPLSDISINHTKNKHNEGNESSDPSTQYEYRQQFFEESRPIELQDQLQCGESVADLLKQWGVSELEEHFDTIKVDLTSLKYARFHQLPDLLQNVPWGIRVKFEHFLFEWQKSIGTYVHEDMYQNNITTSQVVEKHVEHDNLSTKQCNKENTSENTIEVFDLKSVLMNYNEGKMILKLIDSNIKELPEAQRQILVDKIVDYFIQNDKKISVSLARTISNQILCLFPDELKEYYFAPQTNKSPKGKLLAKYYNQMRKLKSIGLIEAPLATKRKQQDSKQDLPEPEEDAIVTKERLKFMQEGERWDEVKLLWKKCENFRRKFLVEDESKNIMNILTEWPSYKHPMGSALIDSDFETIYPMAANVYTKWKSFVEIALELYASKIKDKHCKAVLGKLDNESVSEEGKNVAALLLLHGVIVPTSKKTVKMGTRKVLVKFTITDSQDSFMVTGRSINEVETKLLDRKNQNHPIQPFLVVIFEDDITKPKQYLVCCDQIKYSFLSVVPALDCCFKIFHVFNLKYPLESVAVWQFIQQFFFEIYSDHDIVIPNVSIFHNEIKKKLEKKI